MTSRLMNLTKSLRLCGVCIALSLLSACNSDGAAAQAKDAKSTVSAVPVEVAKAARNPISASYSGTAALTADHEAQVTSKARGVLKKVYVEEGMAGRGGELVAECDDHAAPSG